MIRYAGQVASFVICWMSIAMAASSDSKAFRVAIVMPADESKRATVGNEVLCAIRSVFDSEGSSSRKVQYSLFDSSKGEISLLAIGEKIVRDDFDLVLGPTFSAHALFLKKTLAKAQIPFYAPFATHPEVVTDPLLAVRLPSSDKRQAKLIVDYAFKAAKPRSALIIESISEVYSKYLAEQIANHPKMQALGNSLKRFQFSTGQIDPTKLISLLQQQKPEAVFLPLYSPDAAEVYRLAKKSGIKSSLFGGDAVAGRDDFVKIAGNDSPDLPFYFVQQSAPEPTSPQLSRFKELYKSRCRSLPETPNSHVGFDVASIVMLAIGKLPKEASRRDLTKAIRSTEFQGLTGLNKYGSDFEPTRPIHLYIYNRLGPKYLGAYDENSKP